MSIKFAVEMDGRKESHVTEFSTLQSLRAFLTTNAHRNFNVEVNDDDTNLITLPSKCYWKNEILGAHPTLNEMLYGQ